MSNNTTFLSYDEIDAKASILLNKYDPCIIKKTQESPLELLIELCTDFDLDYQYLSHNQFYLGRTIFNEATKLTVTDIKNTCVYDIIFDRPTILVEQSLIDTNDIRYRFTLAHELGHALLHNKKFYENPDQETLFDPSPYEMTKTYTPLTKNDIARARNIDVSQKNFTNHDWIEWQANTFASTILIPKKSILDFYHNYNQDYRFFTRDTAQKFNTSYSVAKFRIIKLGLLHHERRCEYD